MNVRIHVTLLDRDPSQHERSIMFMECTHVLPDDTDIGEYARDLRVIATVQDPNDSGLDVEVALVPYGT